MPVITLELGEEHEPTQCGCCGNTTRTVHGFVYSNGDARAVYFASWTAGHAETVVNVAIGIGEWGEGGGPAGRLSFGLECRSTVEQIEFEVQGAEQSPWGGTRFLGVMLSRATALEDPNIGEVFHIAEHIIAGDTRIAQFLTE